MSPCLKVGLFLLVTAAALLYMGRGSVPARDGLSEAAGTLTAYQRVTGKGNKLTALRFELGGAGVFEYSRKGGEIDAVAAGLERAGEAPVMVLYNAASSRSPPLAYEIAVGTRVLRPHAEVTASWKRQNALARLFALGCGLGAAACLLVYWLRRPAH